MKEKLAFQEYLKKKGMRLTPEREAILEEVVKHKGHFDPEELHYSLRDKGKNVSRASVYRTIPLMVEAGILEQVERTHTHAHYETAFGDSHHDHMLCLECGSVVEFYSEGLEKLQEKVCREQGFKSIAHTLEIKGYCAKCQKKMREG